MLTRIVTHPLNREIEHVIISLMDEGVYGKKIRDAGVELHCVGIQSKSPKPWLIFKLANIMRNSHPDVIMTWMYHADLLGTFSAMICGISTRRLIWNLRNSNLNFDDFKRSTRITVHILTWLSWLPGVVAYNSEAGKRYHELLGYTPRSWAYLPNGVDFEAWHPNQEDREEFRRELGITKDEILIGMIARNKPQKDFSTFIDACSRLFDKYPCLRIALIGHGTQNIDTSKIPDKYIFVLGLRNDIERLIHGIDIIVLSSAYGEGGPNVIYEAMAAETPCIVTDVGDSAFLVKNSGLVVPSKDAQALADAIGILLQETPEQRHKRGKDARAKIKKEYHLDGVVERYKAIWLKIAKNDTVP